MMSIKLAKLLFVPSIKWKALMRLPKGRYYVDCYQKFFFSQLMFHIFHVIMDSNFVGICFAGN